MVNSNIKLWNNLLKEKSYNPLFPTKNIQAFVEYHLPKKNRHKFKILDVGFGNGSNLIYLKNLGFDAYGIDSSSYAVSGQKNFYNRLDYKNKIKLSSFENLEFDDNYFDAVISDGVLYYGRYTQLRNGVDEIYRVLKKNHLARIYIKTKNDIYYKQAKHKRTSILIKHGWEKGQVLTFLSEKQVKNYFQNFQELKLGIDEFNLIKHKEVHSFWVITAKK
jgi:SAM-dependent methyltransferase